MRRLLRSVTAGMLVAVLAQAPVLFAAPPAVSTPAMGVILQAQRANVGNSTATTGSTIFDGDLLQTDHDGTLQVRLGSAQAYLFNGGSAVVHQSTDGFSANLNRGGLVLSSASGQTFHLLANGATIQPSTAQPTVAQVTWVSPKELLVMSRKGALQVSMGDDTQTVADGQSYRMIIDPVAAGTPAPSPSPAAQGNTQTTGKNKFLLILLGGAAAAVAVGIIVAIESPSNL